MSTLKPEHKYILDQLLELESKGELVGAYEKIPIEVYHHPDCPGISSTQLKTVLRKSITHWELRRDEDSEEKAFGRIFHNFISEPHLIEKARSQDILLADEMFTNLKKHPVAKALLSGAKYEVSFFSKDEATGLTKKCRADLIHFDQKVVGDFKSTRDASLDSFLYDCKKFGYKFSASYYLEIISEVMGERYEDFRLIASEKEPPRQTAVYRVHQKSIEDAQPEIRAGLNKIKDAIDKGLGAWKGYSKDTVDIII